jgi:hypothetical protein
MDMLLFGGCDKIEPGTFTAVEKAPFTPAQTAVAELRETDQVYEAVGTVRPKPKPASKPGSPARCWMYGSAPGTRSPKATC